MSMNTLRAQFQAASAIALALMAGCGGGGSDAPAPPPVQAPPPPPAVAAISGKAVDGALQGAVACYDLNDNKACDESEPKSAATAADGSFTISVAASEAGKHRVIVNVPASAIDADTGQPVGTAFTMVAPATGAAGNQAVFVSPLTTLVQLQMDAGGQTAVQSNDFIKAQLGLAAAPLSDFTAAANADNARAANAAKLVQKASVQQAAAVAAVVGQTDISGAVITQADLAQAAQSALTGVLPSLGAAAIDPALAALTGAAREQALTAAAGQVVAVSGLTAEQARFAIGLPKLPQAAQGGAPSAAAGLIALQYTSASNWFMRANMSTAADNTPDANGLTRFFDVRTRMAPYAYDPTQGVAESFTRTINPELFWNGSAWTACKLGDRFTSTVRDAQGRNSYNYCDSNEKGIGQRAEVDIAGQSLASVWTNRLLPESALTASAANWSLPDATLLGAATFPAGSRLQYNSSTATETAVTYNTQASNRVNVFPDAAAQGGDARGGALPCSSATSALSTNLEEMVARNPGKPCIFNPATNADGTSGPTNEAWGPTTVSLGSIPNGNTQPAGTGNYFTTTALLRVAFTGANNATTYYRCYERRTPSSARNCTAIGSGSYSIATLGNARTMSFNNLPAEVQARASTRVFVERGGAIYFGFKNKVGATFTGLRFNMTAANALLGQLGMPPIQPADAPQPLTGAKATAMATAKGVWGGADASSALVLRFGDNGEFLLVEVDAGGGGRPGLEYGWVDFDPSTQQTNRLLAVDSNGGWGTSHVPPNDGIASITAAAITLKSGEVLSRLADSGSGLVGLWAVGSATDLKATHLAFFANGRVLTINGAETDAGACLTARQGPPGIEWADYSFNASTGAVRIFNKIYDTSGCTGVFDSSAAVPDTEANFVITMAADGKTFSIPGDNGSETVYRIAPQ